MRLTVAGVEKTVKQIFPCIGIAQGDRLLRTGQHDRLWRVLDQIGQCCRRVGHGIGAARDHKSVIAFILIFDCFRHHLPVLRRDIGAVEVQQLQAFYVCQRIKARHIPAQFVCRNCRHKPLRSLLRGNGASCCNKKYFFHR